MTDSKMIKMKYRGRVRVRLVQTEGALSLSPKECKCIQRFKDSQRYPISNTKPMNEIEIEIKKQQANEIEKQQRMNETEIEI